MGEAAFRSEERIGLLAALLLHGALIAVLLVQTVRREVSVFPERMTVSLVSEVGLEAASPDPVAESRAAIAPKLAEQPAPTRAAAGGATCARATASPPRAAPPATAPATGRTKASAKVRAKEGRAPQPGAEPTSAHA